MAFHDAIVHWQLQPDQNFTDNRYGRAHTWSFDGGAVIQASSSPAVVPAPYSSIEAVDPEEALVASLSSCHMLWFLSIAAGRGFTVAEYTDNARGQMGRNQAGKLAMIRVELSPTARFTGRTHPNASEVADMHRAAHASCYIANSVTTDVVCRPTP